VVGLETNVDAAYQGCLDIGVRIEGYYELFVFDSDGIRIERPP
jgi:hypothetical protein